MGEYVLYNQDAEPWNLGKEGSRRGVGMEVTKELGGNSTGP